MAIDLATLNERLYKRFRFKCMTCNHYSSEHSDMGCNHDTTMLYPVECPCLKYKQPTPIDISVRIENFLASFEKRDKR